ncbi:MAG: Vms1/Ankzf1 family peptidyl-tRNA hydrolase [Chloroflexota bacterium]
MSTQVMLPAMDQHIDTLRATPSPTGWVLSTYLDGSPQESVVQTRVLRFRDACKAMRLELPDGQREAFESAVAQTESQLTRSGPIAPPGIALFASGSAQYFYAVPLARPAANGVTWAPTPILGPLQEMLDEYERIAVALFSSERARIFTIYLGQIEARQRIDDEVPAKQSTGGWFALSQGRYARHREEHILRHAKRTVTALMTLSRTHPYDRLILGGPTEALEILKHHLPRPLWTRLAGTLELSVAATDDQVLAAAMAIGADVERREELLAVDELLEDATSSGVALGIGATLCALNERRVHRLFLAAALSVRGGECPSCGALSVGVEACPRCGAATTPVADLRQAIIDRALHEGARIEYVSGEASARLMAHNGLGARVRY